MELQTPGPFAYAVCGAVHNCESEPVKLHVGASQVAGQSNAAPSSPHELAETPDTQR